jgi:hypothetical protein
LIDDLDLGLRHLGPGLTAASLGGLATIGTAVWLDHRGPHPIMALGGAIAVVGTLLLLIASNVTILGLANFVRGVGDAGFASVIFYGVVVKGATHHRGLLLGALAAVSAIGRFGFADDVAGLSNLTGGILFSAGITAVAAYMFYRFLPRVFEERASAGSGAQGEPESLRAIFGTPGFWRTFGPLLAVAALAMALSSTTSFVLPFMLDEMDTELDWPIFFVVPVLSAVAAIGIGAASDRISARQLLIALAIAVVGLVAASATFDGWVRAVIAGVASPLARGGIAVLPWVLLAQLVTVRHYAVIGLIMLVLSGFLGGFLPAVAGFAVDALGSGAWLYAVHLPLAVALVAASFWVTKRPLAHERAETTPEGADPSQ